MELQKIKKIRAISYVHCSICEPKMPQTVIYFAVPSSRDTILCSSLYDPHYWSNFSLSARLEPIHSDICLAPVDFNYICVTRSARCWLPGAQEGSGALRAITIAGMQRQRHWCCTAQGMVRTTVGSEDHGSWQQFLLC